MSNTIKVTVVAGAKSGFEMSFDCSRPVLVGRSRSADLHLPEPDVSGKHFEFVKTDAGCMVRVRSRNGLVVDGRVLQSDDTMLVRAGSVIGVGTMAKIHVDAVLFGADSSRSSDSLDASSAGLISVADEPAAGEVAAVSSGGMAYGLSHGSDEVPDGKGRADLDAETAQDPMPDSIPSPSAPAMDGYVQPVATSSGVSQTITGGVEFTDDATDADQDESLTSAGEDGETQEMKTRVGSLEEIVKRKHQLERTNFHRRVRGIGLIVLFVVVLAVVGYFFGWKSHVIDIDGPYLPDGSFDVVQMDLMDENGKPEFYLDYPRNDAMTVSVSSDSNSVEVASWFGNNSDIPFHLEFTRWNDRTDLMRSLEESFERWMLNETARGSAFQIRNGNRPQGEFFEDVFPTFVQAVNVPAFQAQALRGIRFVRAECTRSRGGDLWRGNCFYFRKGDRIHLLRLEIPDLYWTIAKVRVTEELHLGIYEVFSRDNWDSPGMSGIMDAKFSDDELISKIRHEFSAERVAFWPDMAIYIDTLLVRSWGDKPRIQKEAMTFFLQLQDQMAKFYRERELALATASANGDEVRMKSIITDCKAAFGAFPRDRRLTLVKNPEVWSWLPRR